MRFKENQFLKSSGLELSIQTWRSLELKSARLSTSKSILGGTKVSLSALDLLIPRTTTSAISSACESHQIFVRRAPSTVRGIHPEMSCLGTAKLVCDPRDASSLLEAFNGIGRGDVVVVDNRGRVDHACLGQLLVLEGMAAGASGFIVWGCHRDHLALRTMGFPVFSCGPVPNAFPTNRQHELRDSRSVAFIGEAAVTDNDIVFADEDGVLFLSGHQLDSILPLNTAHIWPTAKAGFHNKMQDYKRLAR
ncbi:RraA family protein [Tateyamaria omphalii]|uniref:RraA family protein n=1 Tax=Tateyamaria omphalii TaxID=299262 RepID=UPI001671B03D|nr:RraA family protein [Tateyamaria omphalii]